MEETKNQEIGNPSNLGQQTNKDDDVFMDVDETTGNVHVYSKAMFDEKVNYGKTELYFIFS